MTNNLNDTVREKIADIFARDLSVLQEVEAIESIIQSLVTEARINELKSLTINMHYFGDVVKIENRIAELKSLKEQS